MVCVTSRGGDYSPDGPLNVLDFLEPYLRTIFNFVGITDIEFINIQPMDITPDLRRMATTKAIKEARDLVLAVDCREHLHTEDVEFPLGANPKPLVE